MTRTRIFLLAALASLAAAPAIAADLPVAAAAAAPAAPAPTTTIGLEVSPEFFADPNNARHGQINDWYGKGTVTETVAPGWSVAGAVQGTDKVSNSPATTQWQVEGSAAYKFKLSDTMSITGTAGLGYTWGNTGYAGGVPVGLGTDPFAYYFVTAALDYKLDSHWTWNIIQARYRNAFTVTWITPKVQTGITYAFDANNAVYANVGYAWKDNGSGLKPDKYNVAVGYKYSF